MGYFITCALGLLLCAGGYWLELVVKRKRAERRKVLEEQRVEAARQKRMLEELVEMPGWKFLAEAAKVQTSGRQNQVMYKPTEDALKQEYMKGEVAGIELFIRLPEQLIENSKAVIDAAMKETGEVEPF